MICVRRKSCRRRPDHRVDGPTTDPGTTAPRGGSGATRAADRFSGDQGAGSCEARAGDRGGGRTQRDEDQTTYSRIFHAKTNCRALPPACKFESKQRTESPFPSWLQIGCRSRISVGESGWIGQPRTNLALFSVVLEETPLNGHIGYAKGMLGEPS